MRSTLVVAALILGSIAAAEEARPRRPVHTYSIVARDPATGQLGVAVQSHWFSVGSNVSWAEAGVGAVATQSFIDPAYGKLGLDLMRAGRSAPEALKALVAADEGRDFRQVAMIDSEGRVDAWTGKSDIQAAGHLVGDNYSAQANLMLSDAVWPAMAEAFEKAEGDLAERMMQALEARQAAGGGRYPPNPSLRLPLRLPPRQGLPVSHRTGSLSSACRRPRLERRATVRRERSGASSRWRYPAPERAPRSPGCAETCGPRHPGTRRRPASGRRATGSGFPGVAHPVGR